jgi:hypothetical protein
MAFFLLKVVVAALVISFTSWLSGKRPELAGFLVALPFTTLLTLAFSFAEYRDARTSVAFARSIFAAVPLSLLFFVPFLFAEKLRWGFWQLYGAGLGLLVVAYFVHRAIMGKVVG